jgi:hypothetical protein
MKATRLSGFICEKVWFMGEDSESKDERESFGEVCRDRAPLFVSGIS